MGHSAHRLWIGLMPILTVVLPALAAAEPLPVRVLGPDGAGVAGMVVYLEPRGAVDPSPPASPAGPVLEIAQQDRRFVPYVGVIRRGEAVRFTNHDDITHHVYSFNGPARFSFHIRPGEENRLADFDTAGIIAMGCNVHDWMSGYLLVLDTPYHARTGAEGMARLEAPAGDYRLTAWHPQLQEQALERTVTLPAEGPVTLTLSRPLEEIPRQQGLDDFDFLERY